MTLDELHGKLTELNVWKRGDERAPHKPLLLLWAMGRAARGEDRLVSFGEVEEPLTGLLRHFGPPRRAYHPEFPFRYLATDGLWEVPHGSSWGKKHLRDQGVAGGLPEPLYRLLASDPTGARLAARRLLDEHFPASMHQHILEAVGLWGIAEAENRVSHRPRRDPRFREAVLTAYERRCAVCDFDLRLKDDLLGLEAAHIQVALPRRPRSRCQRAGAVYVPSWRFRSWSHRSGRGRERARLPAVGVAGGARHEPGRTLAAGLPRPPHSSSPGGRWRSRGSVRRVAYQAGVPCAAARACARTP